MGLRSVFRDALPGIFEAAAEDAVFTSSGGAAIDCHVFIDFNVMLQPAGMDAQNWQRGTTIEALLSQIVDEPNRGDTFIVDGTTYTVQAILENDGLTVKMVVT